MDHYLLTIGETKALRFPGINPERDIVSSISKEMEG
jgi:hypothetical protein